VAADETLVLTDANNTLNKWQEEEAFGHWKRELICPFDSPNSEMYVACCVVMREMIPDVVWETY
jgi:hypothetical protein